MNTRTTSEINAMQRDLGNTSFSAPKRKPFVAKGHDAIIKRFQDSGDQVKIGLISGDSYTGKITARDKYTITLLVDFGSTATPVTIYKHAIELFHAFTAG